jgi:tRNA uracil 4-sulfurtransferase
MPADRSSIIVRAGAEIATKKRRTRGRFQQALKNNLEVALTRRGLLPVVRLRLGRYFVEVGDACEAGAVLGRCFGVASYSPVLASSPSELPLIVQTGVELFAERVRGKRYAVRAIRQGRHSFGSLDVARQLGAALLAAGSVDLERPDVTVFVEVLNDSTYFFSEKIPGPGGLPSAVQGRALVMMSGGFDSAVAAWRVMKRGVAVDFVLFDLGGKAHERVVLSIVRLLVDGWSAGQRPKLHIVEFGEIVDAIKSNVRSQYWQVVLKRMMYRAAQTVAAEIGAEAIVTGESLGQVSSQTLSNLAAIDAVAKMPVLRPLIGQDKTEIIAEARRIGTAALSEHVKEYCAIASGFPVTATVREKVDRHEQRLDLDLVGRVVAARRVLDPRAVSRQEHESYLFTSEIPAGAVVLDCQPPHLYRAWHAPGAQHKDPSDLIDNLRALDKQHTYVLYCSHGTQAATLAELMQRSGYDAYAFRGGAERLRRSLAG